MSNLILDYQPACSAALSPHAALMDTVPTTPPAQQNALLLGSAKCFQRKNL